MFLKSNNMLNKNTERRITKTHGNMQKIYWKASAV